jgi:hypothetical protein
MAGKGDKPRIGDRKSFNNNFDLIKKREVEGFVNGKGNKQTKKY